MSFNQTSFKKADIIIQSAALLITGAICFFDMELAMMIFFLGIGGWQLLSMAVHLTQRWNQHSNARKVYQYLLLAIVCIFLISLLSADMMIWVLYILLYMAPFLALFYLLVCYLEIFRRK